MTCENALQPVPVLNDSWSVEVELGLDDVHPARGRVVPENCIGGVARQHLGGGEDHDRHDEDGHKA